MSTRSRNIALTQRTSIPFDRCLDLIRQSLHHQDLRIVAEIPFHQVFARELGLSWRKYVVLIVWSPFIGYCTALSNRDAGILIPFHLVVAEDETGTVIRATNLAYLGQLAGTIGLQVLTADLNRKIQRIFSEMTTVEGSHETTEKEPSFRPIENRNRSKGMIDTLALSAKEATTMKNYRIWFPLLSLIIWGTMIGAPTAKSADEGSMMIGKRAQVHFSSTTRVGNLTLAPGTYRIQHRVDGTNHLLHFTQPTRPYKSAVVVERHRGNVECSFEALPEKVERTTIDTIEENGVPRITRIQIKGENVAHLF